jgi:hypothetical protein
MSIIEGRQKCKQCIQKLGIITSHFLHFGYDNHTSKMLPEIHFHTHTHTQTKNQQNEREINLGFKSLRELFQSTRIYSPIISSIPC